MDDNPPRDDSLTLTVADRIDRACDRFEAAWGAPERPRIEDYLGDATEPEQSHLLCALLAMELELRRREGEQPEPDDYHPRFPGHEEAIRSIFREVTERASGDQRPRVPVGPQVPRGLLLGLLALQNGFIDHRTLIAAIHAWPADRTRTLGQILVGQGALNEARLALLEALVEEHVRQHGDPERSLIASGGLNTLWRVMDEFDDADARSVLASIVDGDGSDATVTHAGGQDSHRSRFRLMGKHAEGGLGAVFLARDGELKRDVALKQIKPMYAHLQTFRNRFVREAEITGRLEHPGIVPVYALGYYPDGRPYYAMRFIRGKSLKETISEIHGAGTNRGDRRGELTRTLKRFLDVCNAMEYAHSRGVLHRDLKPANIMLGPFGETLVVDWGVAKLIGRPEGVKPPPEGTLVPSEDDPTLAPTRGAVGTWAYMSPEQAAESEDLCPRSDVYSLGAILYCLLAGRDAFEFRGVAERARRAKVIAGEFLPPRKVTPAVPTPLDAICMKAMSRLPQDRYPSARALADDIERWLEDRPVSAFPDPFSVRLARWARRRKPLVAGVVVLLVSAVVGLAIDDIRVGREKARAEENFALARGAVDRVLTEVASGGLAAVPQAERLRAQVAADAREFTERFLRQSPNDPKVRMDAARVYREVGNIDRMLGRANESATSYRQAIDILEKLVAEFPDDRIYKAHLAMTLSDAGEALRGTGHLEDAERLHRRALEITEGQAAQGQRPPPDIQLARSHALLSLAGVRLVQGRPEEARRSAEEAVTNLRVLPVDPQQLLLLSLALTDSARASRELGQTGRAAGRAKAALGVADELLRALTDRTFPGPVPYEALLPNAQYARALACVELARNTDAGHRPDVERLLDDAVKTLSRLAADFPRIPNYRPTLVAALLARSDIQADAAKALADRTRARDLLDELVRDYPRNPELPGLLGEILGKLGQSALERGDRAQARSLLTRAVATLDSGSPAAAESPHRRELLARFRKALQEAGGP